MRTRGSLLDSVFELFQQLRKELHRNQGEQPCSIEGLAEEYSELCDKVIIRSKTESSLSYIGGKLGIELTGNRTGVAVGFTLYFQNQEGQWLSKSFEDEWDKTKLDVDSWLELKRLERVEFDIREP